MLRALDQIGSPADFVIEHVSGAGKLTVTDAQGEYVNSVEHIGQTEATELNNAVATLLDVYFGYGSGNFAANQITCVDQLALAATVNSLTGVLPREALNFVGDETSIIALFMGKLAFCERPLTTEDRMLILAWARARGESTEPTKPNRRSSGEEEPKQDEPSVLNADHAIVVADDKRYCIPFDSVESRFLCRVLQAIEEIMRRGDKAITERSLRIVTWRLIPEDERQVYLKFCNGQDYVTNWIMSIMENAAPLFDLTERGLAGGHKYINARSLKVTVRAEPPEPVPGTVMIYPEDTNEASMVKFGNQAFTEQHAATAAVVLGYALKDGRVRLDHDKAVSLVEFIMTREGKAALLRHILETGADIKFSAAYARLHAIARRTLRESYFGTRDEMVIHSGNWLASRRVKLTGGRLSPAQTRANLANLKWIQSHPTQAPSD